MYVRNNINLLTRGSTFVEWPIVQRTRDNFHQNAAHTRQTQIEQRTRGKFQESGMPECPNRMPECPNRTVLTSFQECSNQTDYQVCLVSRATIHQFRMNLHDSCQKACGWLLQICRPKRSWNELVQPKKMQWRLNAIRIEEIQEVSMPKGDIFTQETQQINWENPNSPKIVKHRYLCINYLQLLIYHLYHRLHHHHYPVKFM